MNAEPNDHPTPPPEPVKPPARRPFAAVVHCPGDRYRHLVVEASAAPEAAGEALLAVYGDHRPAHCPDRVDVEGVSYRVDEWAEARVFMVPDPAAPAGLERLRAERALFHLERAGAALLALAEACHDPEDASLFRFEARQAGFAAANVRAVARRGRP